MILQPENMRFRGISVLTNTPIRGPQRGPGENQTAMAIEPFLDEAAAKLKIDRVALRRVNAALARRRPPKAGFDREGALAQLLELLAGAGA